MRRIFPATLGILVGCGFGGGLGLMVADRFDPVIVSKTEVLTPEVRPGGNLHIRIHAYRLRNDCHYIEGRSFIGTDLVHRDSFLEQRRQRQELGPIVEDLFIRIPATMPQGRAKLATTLAYECGANPLHRWWPIIVSPLGVRFNVSGDPDTGNDG